MQSQVLENHIEGYHIIITIIIITNIIIIATLINKVYHQRQSINL